MKCPVPLRGSLPGGHDALALRNLRLHTETVDFVIRDYRAADFDLLWQIDQVCFPPGIAYTQMDLTGFVTRRKVHHARGGVSRTTASLQATIAGFAVAQPIRNIGRILTLDILPEARRFGLGSRLMEDCEHAPARCRVPAGLSGDGCQ